ncbi:MAG TPA: hypothetical protein VMT24_16665 [Aggregatilineaceae bacterium]|jgi:hypothetical protein|nr:hypothetical protein [Aggregatilineaceae bacterium]
MHDNTRLIATLIIWLVFALVMGIVGAVLVFSNVAFDLLTAALIFGIVVIMATAVASSTSTIWGSHRETDRELDAAKAKRTARARIERLVESLDDDEVYELEALLLDRDEKTGRGSQP